MSRSIESSDDDIPPLDIDYIPDLSENFETTFKNETLDFKTGPFLDFEVEIDGVKYRHNRTILAQKFSAIYHFVLENPGKEMPIVIPNVEPRIIRELLNACYSDFSGRPECLYKHPFECSIIAEYLQIIKSESAIIENFVIDAISGYIHEFVNKYQLPFTEINPEIAKIIELRKYPIIKRAFQCALIDPDFSEGLSKMAAHIHLEIITNEIDQNQLFRQIQDYTFPIEFCQKLKIPYFEQYFLESIKPDEKGVRLIQVVGKRKDPYNYENTDIIPFDEIDYAYFEYMNKHSEVQWIFTKP